MNRGQFNAGRFDGPFARFSASSQQTFRQALFSKLTSIPEVTALVGGAIYPGAIPETHSLARDGPALTYTITSYPRGHVLTGSDGTATATVQLSAWAYQESAADAVALAVWNALDGVPINPWGTGYLWIMSVVHKDEEDLPEPPKAGRDQSTYQIASTYEIRHQVGALPSLS
jgi:Protein of unknown function (DUF3168)